MLLDVLKLALEPVLQTAELVLQQLMNQFFMGLLAQHLNILVLNMVDVGFIDLLLNMLRQQTTPLFKRFFDFLFFPPVPSLLDLFENSWHIKRSSVGVRIHEVGIFMRQLGYFVFLFFHGRLQFYIHHLLPTLLQILFPDLRLFFLLFLLDFLY